ncbi:MAG TPA: VOC family protein [Ktedonobacteraceae bacterium]|nr:VOC family protein [Ktedonobacteraceae bacterium]
MANPIVHIEIPATNTSAAGKFYGEVFGWKIEADQMYGYVQFQSEGGPGGGFVDVEGAAEGHIQYKPDSLLVYLATDDIDATLAIVEAHGGKTVLPKTEIPHVGWFAVFTDPSGNRLALFTPAPHE